jgi:deazaflavin-dependent oxidoreductase (nitroreductase family)
MKAVNRPMRQVLRLPFPTPVGRRLMLVIHVGRRSGRIYRQPVSYVRDGDRTLLTPGGGRWTRNLTEDKAVELRINGRPVVARPELVRDPDDVTSLLGRMLAANPRLASFVPFVEPDGRIDRDELVAAISYGFCVVRWHLEDVSDGRPA